MTVLQSVCLRWLRVSPLSPDLHASLQVAPWGSHALDTPDFGHMTAMAASLAWFAW